MAVYVVTWNLNKEGARYTAAREAFFARLRAFDFKRDAGLETVAWVSTNLNANQVNVQLSPAIDTSDRLFISKVHAGETQGSLEGDVWTWINARV